MSFKKVNDYCAMTTYEDAFDNELFILEFSFCVPRIHRDGVYLVRDILVIPWSSIS